MESPAKKILIGISGRIDSLVAAYLLKKQGYEVYAVTILFNSSESVKDEESRSLPSELVQYAVTDLQQVSTMIGRLEIPFYAVNAQDEYFAQVFDLSVAARMMGKFFDSKLAATNLLMKLLAQKSQELGIDLIATGHFAKMTKNQKTGENRLFSCPDLLSDQSYLLARLEADILKRLILPLADMRKVDVQKVSKVMSAKGFASQIHPNIFERNEIGHHLDAFIPSSLKRKGTVVDRYDAEVLAEHEGLHQFYLGQSSNGSSIDSDHIVTQIDPKTGRIFVDEKKRLVFDHLSLNNCLYLGVSEFSKPLDVYLQFHEQDNRLRGRLQFKNNRYCVVSFTEAKVGFIPAGTYVVAYAKTDGIARVVMSGFVDRSFYIDGVNARSFPVTAKEKDGEPIELPALKDQMGF